MISLWFMAAICIGYVIFLLISTAREPEIPPIPKAGCLAIAAWGCSYLMNEAWVLASTRDGAILVWQLGLCGICLMYLGVKGFAWRATPTDYILAVAALTTLGIARAGGDRNVLEFVLIALIVTCCARCYLEVGRRDLFGKLTWAVTAIAEAAQLPLFAACRLVRPQLSEAYLRENWGDVSRYACERAFDPVITHVTTFVTGFALLWFTYRWFFPRGGYHGRTG